jgi:AcrR family transcriptional regulator
MAQTPRARRIPVQERSRSTVNRILDAAEAIAAKDGPEAVTTRAIADRAGVAAPSIYRFFTDRNEIFDGLLARGLEDLEARTNTAERSWTVTSAAELLSLQVELFAVFFERHPALARLWFEGRASAAVADQVRLRHRDLAHRMHTGLRTGGLIPTDMPAVVFEVAVELADRVLALSFSGRNRRDRTRIRLGKIALEAYIERVISEAPEQR